MRRSQINHYLADSLQFLAQMQFVLPPWAYWEPARWKGRQREVSQIVSCQLGWDLTDFGSGDFATTGLILFTMRNGNAKDPNNRKPYAEKVMIVRENQQTPLHFHSQKIEDIINRGGGNLVIELYGASADNRLAEAPISVSVDGIARLVPAGGRIVLQPGESITLEQRVYHRFYGEPRSGKVLVGEISSINDDASDNHFYTAAGRFPQIEPDQSPLHLLITDYRDYL